MTQASSVLDSDRPATRLAALRAALAQSGVDGLVVPHTGPHHTEFVPPCDARLAWLTGFTGSAGVAVVLADRAALFVDGRYTLQAPAQVPGDLFAFHHLVEEPPATWLRGVLAAGQRLGIDPWLHTPADRDSLEKACTAAGAHLVALEPNPLDALWTDRPPAPRAPVVPHPLVYTGRDSAAKRAEIANVLDEANEAAVVLSAPDSIAWLLNIRGGDVAHTPLPLSFALLDFSGRVTLFLDPAKETAGLRDHLGPDVSLATPEDLGPALEGLGAAQAVVRVDRSASPSWIAARLTAAGARVSFAPDPCQRPKACKTPAELAGARAAHHRDGLAMARFLHWLEEAAPGGGVTEGQAAARLEACRRQDPMLRDLSFPTISAAGPNAALCHYQATPETDRPLEPGGVYLVDSGGQYPDGTTDVTRTVAVGPPQALEAPGMAEVRRCFTLVLKGHIALARACFPRGTTGLHLDALARQFLWRDGLTYDHGTGHGVGSYLGVHEGPARIATSRAALSAPLEEGMILSNEPGYYQAGAFGIRIENLVAVRPRDSGGMPEGGAAPDDAAVVAPGGAAPAFLAFETLTLVPIDRRLIALDLLEPGERAWLNAYHARVWAAQAPALEDEAPVLDWLRAATAPL